MKKKNESLLLFFASPRFQSQFWRHQNLNNPAWAWDEYREFCNRQQLIRNSFDEFKNYYGLYKKMYQDEYARFCKTKYVRFSTPATRGKSWVQSQLENMVDDRVKVATDPLEGKLLEIEWELAACQAKIKSLEEQLRNKEEQIVGKVSVWKQCIPWCDDRPGVAYQDYLEWCKDRNLKPVSPHEFEKQMK